MGGTSSPTVCPSSTHLCLFLINSWKGPCQFPTLGFVVHKWNLVKGFVSEPFWYIYLALTREGEEEEIAFQWKRHRLFDEMAAASIYEVVMDDPVAQVTKVIQKGTKKWYVTHRNCSCSPLILGRKPLPLTTVELQKAGSRLLKLAPKKVLDVGLCSASAITLSSILTVQIAEHLYQQGFLSYPRTETDQFDPAFDFHSLIQKQTVDPGWGQFAAS